MQGYYFEAALMSVYPLFNGFADYRKSPKYPYPKQPYSAQKIRAEKDEEKLQRTSALIQEHNLMMRAKIQQRRIKTKAPPET